MEAHRRLEKKLKEGHTTEGELRKIVEIKTGRPAGFPKLKELTKLWSEIPRRKEVGQQYVKQCTGILKRFVEFVDKRQPGIQEFIEVKPQTAKAYLDTLQKRGVSPSTWNYSLELLRTAFRRLHPELPEGSNPFRHFVTKSVETVSREPFTPAQLKAIQEACLDDDFIRPVIITGMCSAMRRGDCCCLKWADVDLKEGFISVKTSKTGQKVDIPIFPLLRDELLRAKAAGGKSPYCFPEPAAMYQRNADGISVRVKLVLARAFKQLNGIEGVLQADRPKGLRRASIRDFHSFRVTWITIALAAGVPLELVQRVTGHRTVEVVMKHYFRPGREDFRQVILKAMPKMLADGGAQRSAKERMRDILEGMSVKTWKRDREQLLNLLSNQ
jgi:integrase